MKPNETKIVKYLKFGLLLVSWSSVCVALISHYKIVNVKKSLEIPIKVEKPLEVPIQVEKKPFTILFWTKWYGGSAQGIFGRTTGDCPEFRISWNKSDYSKADIVVFQIIDLDLRNLPTTRDPKVPWLIAVQEAPIHRPKSREQLNRLFNGSWSFRKDSDVRTRYDLKSSEGLYENKKLNEDWIYGSEFSKEFIKNKTKLASWVVSAIKDLSHRKKLKDLLVRGNLSTDIYGWLGMSCALDESCFEKLGLTYKFYLAFENALCEDYITEKIQHGLFHGMVPVVYGMGSVDQVAPPNSFINILDFPTISDLIKRINYLDKNPAEYFKYFEWRQKYRVEGVNPYNQYHCTMWRQMKAFKEKSSNHSKVIEDFDEWYNYFYNERLGRKCETCLGSSDIDLEHPVQNRIKIYNDTNRCKNVKVSLYKYFFD